MLRIACVFLLCLPAAFAAETPSAITPDGGRYYGPLVKGKLHGRGRILWANGTVYEGQFVNGLMSGRGRFRFANGNLYEGELRSGLMSGRGRYEVAEREVYEGEFKEDYYWGQGELQMSDGRSYRGEFVRGEYHGQGRLEISNGDVYEGRFSKGEFTGPGTFTRKNGSRYEGELKNWLFHGKGRYVDDHGYVWEGNFAQGQLEGPGTVTGRGSRYEGELKDWRFHGRGVLEFANGDKYEGSFAHGVYDGEGTLTYARPKPDGRTQDSGVWRYGHLPQEAQARKTRSNVELALYSQKELLDKALAALRPRERGKINLYLLSVAGDGSQEVFRREVDYVQAEFARRFGTAGRSVALVNSRHTAGSAPMATVTSIREALKAIGSRMDREQDILFLFLTSHGSAEHELTLNQDGMALAGLGAAELGGLLKESGIRWKVVVVSACYSGGFIDALQDERTLVITAARRDRRSFGCADENDFTYFGRAFFKESLPKSLSFQDAFHKAEDLVNEWETQDQLGKQVEEDHSRPQISSGTAIETHLKRWWGQAPR